MKKKSWIASAVVALGTLASAAGALYMYKSFFSRKHASASEFDAYDEFPELKERLFTERSHEEWKLTAFDGLNLKAHFFPAVANRETAAEGDTAAGSATEPSHVYAIIMHGYASTYCSMLPQAIHFMEKGYNLLLPEQRGHGGSEGDYFGFGFHEHYDLQAYINMVCDRDPEAQILLLGVSMGAATVMMAAGEYLPDNVKCVIEDCGYTSGWDQNVHVLKSQYHLPAFPTLHFGDLLMRLKHHYSYKEAAPIKYVAQATVPMLFIHGDQDNFVPFSMLQPLYEACTSPEKDFLVVVGAEHANSVLVNPELYWQKVDNFVKQYITE